MKHLLWFTVTLLFLSFSVFGANDQIKTIPSSAKQDDTPNQFSWININNFSTIFNWDGRSARDLETGNPSAFFPRSIISVVFEEGLVWGGLVNEYVFLKPRKRVGGSAYTSGLSPGWVADGVPADWDNNPAVRIYRIRKDFRDISDEELRRDAMEMLYLDRSEVGEDEINAIRQQYERDWDEWPVEHGAPFNDLNDNGLYEPDLNETPGLLSADQVLWYAMNDFDDAKAKVFAGSPGIDLEIQVTVWGYKESEIYADRYYKRYKIINLSGVSIDSLYVGQWVDPDVGFFGDDFVGCDSLYNTGYCYNGSRDDSEYNKWALAPGAVAYQLLYGPVVPAPGETALFNLKRLPGFKNLPMTSYTYSIDWISMDYMGEYELEWQNYWYNQLRGYVGTFDDAPEFPYTNSLTGEPTFYPLSGNPVTQSGDVDGLISGPGDRRMMLNTGPFHMAPADTQEIIYSVLAALGNDHMDSIEQLRNKFKANLSAFNNLLSEQNTKPVMTLYGNHDNLSVRLSWTDLREQFFQTSYRFIGYDLFQIDPSGKKVKIANYDVVDGIRTISDLGVVVYSGEENGDTTAAVFVNDQITGHEFEYGTRVRYGIVGYVFNPYAPDGKKVLSNEDEMPVATINLLPNDYTGYLDITHEEGTGSGEIFVEVFDASKLNNDQFRLSFDWNGDSSAVMGELYNVTEDILIDKEIEFIRGGTTYKNFLDLGFKITIIDYFGFYDWSYDGERWISGVNWGGDHFLGGADIGANFFGSTLGPGDLETVQILFQDSSDVLANGFSSIGAVYRRDLDYAHAGSGEIPFAAYDMSDTLNPRQLNICFVEDDSYATANKIWDMGWNGSSFPDDLGAREYIFIMSSTYNEGVDYDDNNYGPEADVYYAIWPKNRGDRNYLQAPFTMNFISGQPYGYESKDVFQFTAKLDLPKSGPEFEPEVFMLAQNYPNPFNPVTTIAFNLTVNTHVVVEVFNILGQRIETLVSEPLQSGPHYIQWNATYNASGLYFVRLRAQGRSEMKKIMLLK